MKNERTWVLMGLQFTADRFLLDCGLGGEFYFKFCFSFNGCKGEETRGQGNGCNKQQSLFKREGTALPSCYIFNLYLSFLDTFYYITLLKLFFYINKTNLFLNEFPSLYNYSQRYFLLRIFPSSTALPFGAN